jgi:signal transduction histidine kinase
MLRVPRPRVVRAATVILLIWLAMAATLAIAARRVELAARASALQRAERTLDLALRASDPIGFARSGAGEGESGSPHLEFVPAERIAGAFGDPRVALWRRALDSGKREARLDRRHGALAVAPLEQGGLLEASVPAAEIAGVRDDFVARSLPWAGLLALAVALVAVGLVRRATKPLERLARATARAARGDVVTPLPLAGEPDVGGLVGSIEALRRRLLVATEELERRRFENEVVLSGVADGVFAVDRDRRVRYLSPRAAAMLGTSPEEAIGRFCGDLLRPLPVDGVLPCESTCPILQARFRGTVRVLERIRPGDGGEIAALLSSAPEAGGLQVQILREESAVEAARRARDAVVADLAHELKTPLAAQRASLELLRDRLAASGGAGAAGEGTGELVAGIEAGTLRLGRLIDNLLESVRIESGELAIRRRPVELEEVVEEAVATTAALFAKRAQRLEVDLPYPMPRVTGDAPRLGQVLVNLLANAAKFAPEGSEVRVGGTVEPGRIALWVEDQGAGFEARDLPRLSARFRRGVDESGRAEAREEGSGLGLWIARSIAERHGGGLAVERHDDRTRVILWLPAAESAVEESTPMTPQA